MFSTIASDLNYESSHESQKKAIMDKAYNNTTGWKYRCGFLGLYDCYKQLSSNDVLKSPSTIEGNKKNVLKTIEDIGTNGMGPSNYKAIQAAINKAYTDLYNWYRPIYSNASQIFDKRSRADYENYEYEKGVEEAKREKRKQEICEKCKIDVKKTVMPKGYYQPSGTIFSLNEPPAESDESGVIVNLNGDEWYWKYIYYHDGDSRIEVSGESSDTYNNYDEMFQ